MSDKPQEQICLICQKPIEYSPIYSGPTGPFHHNCWLKKFVAAGALLPGLSREEVRQRAAIAGLAEKCQYQRPAEAARSAAEYANALVAELEKPCQE